MGPARPWAGAPSAGASRRNASAPRATLENRLRSASAARPVFRVARAARAGRPGPRSSGQHLPQGGEERHDVAPACRVAHAADPPDLARQLAGSGPDLDAEVSEEPDAT